MSSDFTVGNKHPFVNKQEHVQFIKMGMQRHDADRNQKEKKKQTHAELSEFPRLGAGNNKHPRTLKDIPKQIKNPHLMSYLSSIKQSCIFPNITFDVLI